MKCWSDTRKIQWRKSHPLFKSHSRGQRQSRKMMNSLGHDLNIERKSCFTTLSMLSRFSWWLIFAGCKTNNISDTMKTRGKKFHPLVKSHDRGHSLGMIKHRNRKLLLQLLSSYPSEFSRWLLSQMDKSVPLAWCNFIDNSIRPP